MNLKKLKFSLTFGLLCTLLAGLTLVLVPFGQGNVVAKAVSQVATQNEPSPFLFTAISSTEANVRLADRTVTRAIVPQTAIVNGVELTVTEIAANGFANAGFMEMVRLPRTIRTIGISAFMNSRNLSSITLPAVETIGANAFAMTDLDHLIIPATTTSVGTTILRSTSTQVYVRGPESQADTWISTWNGMNTITDVEFNSQFTPEIQYQRVEFGNIAGFRATNTAGYVVRDFQPFVAQDGVSIYIPAIHNGEPVVGIADWAFAGNDLESITVAFADTPIRIGSYSMWGVNGTSITINREVEFINELGLISDNVFAASTVSTIILPDSVTEFGDFMFQGIFNLNDIHFIIPEILTQNEEMNLINTLHSTGVIELPYTLTSIGMEAFSQLPNINEIYVPESVVEMGMAVFTGWNVPQLIRIGFESEDHLGAGWHPSWRGGIINQSIIEFAAPQIFTITYHLNGGTHENNPETFTPRDEFLLAGATRTGYLFDGWFDFLGGTRIFGISTGTVGDVVLHAAWSPITYTVTFDSNRPANASGTITGATGNSTHTFNVPSGLTPNGFLLPGWTFVGWNTAANGNGTPHIDGSTILNLSTENNVIITLFAQWVANSYNIHYNSNRPGTASNPVFGNMDNSPHTFDSPSNLRANAFTLAGWTFIGWRDAAGNFYSDGAEVRTVTTSGTVVLFAQWVENNYTISYDRNRPTNASNNVVGSMANSSHTFDVTSNLHDNAFTLTGWTFVGWNTAADGSGTVFVNAQQVLTVATGGMITLFAQWVANTYHITYAPNRPGHASNHVTGTMASTSHLFDTPSDLRGNTFALVGWNFIGWNTMANGTGAWFLNGQPIQTVATSGTVTLYAQWEAFVITIIYNANGGVGSMASTTHTFDTPSNLTLNAFTRFGHRFNGWRDANGNVFSNGQSMTTVLLSGTITLNAQWIPLAMTVVYNSNSPGRASQAITGTMANSIHTYGVQSNLDPNNFRLRGWTFQGWNTEANGTGTAFANGADFPVTRDGTLTLFAQWAENNMNVRVRTIEGDEPPMLIGGTPHSEYWVMFEDSITVSAPSLSGYSFFRWSLLGPSGWVNFSTSSAITVAQLNSQHSHTVHLVAHYTRNSCFAPGTLVTLADGSRVAVENLTGDELLLVWNFQTGTFDFAPIIFIDSDPKALMETITLRFTRGTHVTIIDKHGFWNFTLNKFVWINAGNAQDFVGHEFKQYSRDRHGNMTWERVRLANVQIRHEYTTAWSPVTFSHFSLYINGLLSVPAATHYFLNIFDVVPGMLIRCEIDYQNATNEFGLLSFEMFEQILPGLPEIFFHAFNGQYLLIAMGRELVTWDDLYRLIARYGHFFGMG